MAAPVWEGYGGTIVDDSTSTGGHWSSTEPTSGGGLPSGLSSGDVMLAFVTTRDTAYTLGTPNGWTLVAISESAYCAVYGRAWQSGDSAPSFDWTNGGSPYSVVVARISGADPNPSNWVAGTPNTGTSATVTAPSVNTPANDSLVVRLYYQSDNNTTSTPPGSHTLRIRTSTAIGSDAMFAVYTINQATQGSTGTADCVFSASDPYWGETIAIGPYNPNATVTPASVASATAIPTPTPLAGATLSPATVASVASVGTAVPSGSITTAPTIVTAVAAVGSPTLQAGTTLAPTAVAATTSVGTATPSGSGTVAPSAVTAVAAIPNPVVIAGSPPELLLSTNLVMSIA